MKEVTHTAHFQNIDIEENLLTLLITWPDAAARDDSEFSYLYQGGKWIAEDDGFSNDDEIFNGNE